MVYAIFTFIALGIAGGYFFLGLEHKDLLDEILMSALYFMVFVAGIEIGGNRHIIKKICNPQSILLAVAIPTAVTIGSLGGAALSAFVTGMEMRDALLVGSALGWYSLSSVVISTLYSVEIGTIAFLANMLREVLAFLAIPLLVKINKFLALAPSGAATMDSGLPVVIKYTNIHVGLFAFINGLLLTLLVPVLLSVLICLVSKKEIPRLFKTSAGLLFLAEKFVVFVNVFYRRQLLGDQGLSLLRQ